MKRIIFFFLLFAISFVSATYAQNTTESLNVELPKARIQFNKPYSLKTGLGYFYCLPAPGHGSAMWLEFSHRLKTGFLLTYKAQFVQSYMKLKNTPFNYWDGDYKPDIFNIFDISMSRQFRLFGSNHIFEPGLGLQCNVSNTWLVPVRLYSEGIIFEWFEAGWLIDFGLSLKLDYHYQFKNGFFCGVRATAYYVFDMWVEGLTITPILGIKF